MKEPRWRKSSFTGNQGNCVELASTLDQLRDSKNPANVLPAPALRDLVRAVKGGHLEH